MDKNDKQVTLHERWAINGENTPFRVVDDSDRNHFRNLREMIQAFKNLNITNLKKEQTFMQISGYPHFENVCSNLLSFYFHTEETHSFKDLFVRSLLECIGEDKCSYTTENVDRERVTDNNNRIDIVIETENHLIGIENKIFSRVHNDLNDYEKYINDRAIESEKTAICILLSLREETESIKNSSFHNVTYSKLFKKIKENLGLYVIEANTKWIILLNDFIKTIEELQEGTVLDKEFVEFYNTYETDINNLVNARNNFSKSIKAKCNNIKQLIQIEEGYAIEQNLAFYKEDCSAEYWLEYDNGEIESKIVLDVFLTPKGCGIIIGIENSTLGQKEKLENLLIDNKLTYWEWLSDATSSEWSNAKDYFLLEKFDVLEPEEIIAQKFQDILDIVCS